MGGENPERESHYLTGVKDTESEKEKDGGRDGGTETKIEHCGVTKMLITWNNVLTCSSEGEREREKEKEREKIANPLSQEHSQCHRDSVAYCNWVPARSASLDISNSDYVSQMKMRGFI